MSWWRRLLGYDEGRADVRPWSLNEDELESERRQLREVWERFERTQRRLEEALRLRKENTP